MKACKTKLHKMYDRKVEGLRIRSMCHWYEKGKKSSEFFLTLEILLLLNMLFKTKLKL